MDVSGILAEQAERHNAVNASSDAFELDPGFLLVSDPNPPPLDPPSQPGTQIDLESHLSNTALPAIQSLITTLLTLPTQPTPSGPLTLLPAPTTLLPRSKPLPKTKELTKWERFAKMKGISKQPRERRVWDEERGEWVERWGIGARGAKSRKGEGQWATEVKANADLNANPEKDLRDARKARVAKNERQRLQNAQNAARSQEAAVLREKRKGDIERTMATTRVSTASMGKFDRKLEGEKKVRGVKRKFDPTERSVEDERKSSLAIISKLDSGAHRNKNKNAKGGGDDGVLNVRKAIRGASKGQGAAALGRQQREGKKGKGRR